MKKIGILMLVLCCSSALCAKTDPVVKEVKKTIRGAFYQTDGNEANKVRDRLNDAEKKLLEALPKQKTAREKAQCYYYAGMVQKRFNSIENTKLYLKVAMDTVRFYDSLYKMYTYLIQCDSVEQTGNKRLCYRTRGQKHLLKYRSNLLNGGRYYLKKKNYQEAYRFLNMYLWSAERPILSEFFLAQTDSMYVRAAYWATTAAYYSGNYNGVVNYAETAIEYPKNRIYIQEYACKAYLALGDTAGWIKELKTGIINFPEHTYFFTNLMDYLNRTGQYERAMEYAEHMIAYDPKRSLYWFAKASVYMYKKDYLKCLDVCNDVLSMDSLHLGANLFKGTCCYNLAMALSDSMKAVPVTDRCYKTYRRKMQGYCMDAVAPLEFVRAKRPDDAARWAPMLYTVYLNLNKGKEFEEIDKIMNNLKTSEN